LGAGLDALGDSAAVQAVGKLQDRGGHGQVPGALGDPGDETLGDLESCRTCATIATRSGLSWRRDRFTAIRSSARAGSAVSQRRNRTQALRSAHSPIVLMLPEASATGMNSSGPIAPTVGMVPAHQRLRTGDLPGDQIDHRWYSNRN